jgi:hypothetical protein
LKKNHKYKILFVIGFLLVFQSNTFAQSTPPKKENTIKHVTFSNVQSLLLINYSHGLSSGKNVYTKYQITKRKTEFLIEAFSDKQIKSSWTIPYSKSEIESNNDMDRSEKTLDKKLIIKTQSEHYFSEKQTYTINKKSYVIYKHIDYNCYDPFCGTKHNHTTFNTGETYFSPEFGILLGVDDQNLEYNLMARIKEKEVPHDLILHILKERKTDKKIIQEYIRKTQ